MGQAGLGSPAEWPATSGESVGGGAEILLGSERETWGSSRPLRVSVFSSREGLGGCLKVFSPKPESEE